MDAALFSSKRGDWLTPEWLLHEIREFAGEIGLDPCANALGSVGAITEWDGVEVDGLQQDWAGYGFTYVNSPYGRGIGAWQKKCRTADECISLIPARTDTRYFQESCAPPMSEAVCFIRGRLKFLQPQTGDLSSLLPWVQELDPAPFPSALVYWGNRAKEFEERFRMIGAVWLPHTRVHAVVDAVPMQLPVTRYVSRSRGRRVPQYAA